MSKIKAILKKIIPLKFRMLLKRIYYDSLDALDKITFRHNKFIPPRRDIFVGDGNFKKIGEEFLNFFINIGGLQPNHHVLDIGSGIGRMAIPLTEYITRDGSYNGMEIVLKGVEWCNKNITPVYPNFHFHHIDVYNKQYNPTGRFRAQEYRFPFENKKFDFIFLTSVFTHMLPEDVENYISEISRLLKPSCRCFLTFFLINPEALYHIEKGESKLIFKKENKYWTTNSLIPESAIAYEEDFIQNLLQKHFLKIIPPIYYGSWCGRKNYLSYQDILIAELIENAITKEM